jgi:hypothetical protein
MNNRKSRKSTVNEGVFSATKRFSDAFFDGLKVNAINKAITAAEKNSDVPPKIIQKMRQIDKLANELKNDLKYYSGE